MDRILGKEYRNTYTNMGLPILSVILYQVYLFTENYYAIEITPLKILFGKGFTVYLKQSMTLKYLMQTAWIDWLPLTWAIGIAGIPIAAMLLYMVQSGFNQARK